MASPILVTGAAVRVGAVGCTVTELLLKHGKTVRAIVRTEGERAQGWRDLGAEVVVGDRLDLGSMQQGNCVPLSYSVESRLTPTQSEAI